MPSEGFQVGIVKGPRWSTRRASRSTSPGRSRRGSGLSTTVFVQNRFDRLFSAGAKPFDLAIGEISITAARKRTVDFSRAVHGSRPGRARRADRSRRADDDRRSEAAEASARSRSRPGAEVAQQTIAPTRPVLLVGNVPTLMLDLQTGRCEAVVYDAPALGTLKARAPLRYGPFVGVVKTGEQYGIAIPKGGTLLAPVNKALASLLADGTVDRLARKWLTVDPTKLRVLR